MQPSLLAGWSYLNTRLFVLRIVGYIPSNTALSEYNKMLRAGVGQLLTEALRLLFYCA